MLQNQGSDPHIVGRDWSALLTQLLVNGGVMMRGLFIGVEHADAMLHEKAAEDGFVSRSLGAHRESSAQFPHHDERQPDFVGEFDSFDDGRSTAAKVGVAVGVERQPHFHISSSMVSCAASE